MRTKECAAAIAAVLWLAGTAAAQPAITVLQNFDGIPADNVAPPNTTGKAGATQFVQWVNHEFAIYDKNSGQQLQAPQPGNSLWTGFGGPCATLNTGQPPEGLSFFRLSSARRESSRTRRGWPSGRMLTTHPLTFNRAASQPRPW